ncbi:MAG: hypothetical protein JXR80_01295 [Deltaproteobacteria bacterium]|nr:hypothetical protein [Deltaproteobacteria bacterium]
MIKKPTVFEPYEFTVGERILRRRKGKLEDWDVIAVNDKEVTVKCPFHGMELTWPKNHFWFGGDCD